MVVGHAGGAARDGVIIKSQGRIAVMCVKSALRTVSRESGLLISYCGVCLPGRQAGLAEWGKGCLLCHRRTHGVRVLHTLPAPQVLAAHQALRCRALAHRPLVALDACCGCGGNVIQMAVAGGFKLVLGVEISPKRVEMARHNAGGSWVRAGREVPCVLHPHLTKERGWACGRFSVSRRGAHGGR